MGDLAGYGIRTGFAPVSTSAHHGHSSVNGQSGDRVPTADVLRAALELSLSRVIGPLVLAVSGGRDSMALMHAVARWAPDRLAAVATFDHGTGGYATEAAALVAVEARRLGVPVVRERARTPANSEAAWRAARWSFLQRVARAFGASVATAHTRDDQLETIVMRLMRGAGARGLAALAAPSSVVRPWLAVSRGEVASWATEQSMLCLEDPMNASRRFQRGRVRHDLLPALARLRPTFAEEMLALGEQAAAWRRSLEAFVDSLAPEQPRVGVLRISTTPFEATTAEGRAVLWSASFARVGIAIDARGTRELVRFSMSRRRGARAVLAGGATVLRVGEGATEFYELRRSAARQLPHDWTWTGGAGQVPPRLGRWRFRRLSTLDAREAGEDRWLVGVPIDAVVTVRSWQAGDRIHTRGAPAGRRVTRYFSETHVPALDRMGWPVVLVAGAPMCVPGICRAMAAPHRPGWPDSIWYRCEREYD